MKLPKSAPGVTRGMSALSGYNGQVGVEPSPCRWDGTAPFCAGQCQPGEKQVAQGQYDRTDLAPGFGASCVTGIKVRCCK